MSDQTKIEFKFTEQEKCPMCGSENIEWGDLFIDTDTWQECTCTDCDCEFHDVYKYSHREISTRGTTSEQQ